MPSLTSSNERTAIIALHCSGAGANQWRALDELLGGRTVEIIDQQHSKIHLVGHSYGSGVALRAALERPHGVASITLYEPSAFHLLKGMGTRGAREFAEILGIAARTAEGVVSSRETGALRRARSSITGAGMAHGHRCAPRCRRCSRAGCPRRRSISEH